MSTTNNLACDTCKETLWVGQRDYLYTEEGHLETLRRFLETHKNEGHQLSYYTDDWDYIRMDYAEFSDRDAPQEGEKCGECGGRGLTSDKPSDICGRCGGSGKEPGEGTR